ncbi:laccase [Pleurotus ostreatus]|uniref:Laccase n=1 Tax=Pleurotus ostreatus TaxID=5322 RepID=A0A8H7DTH0_PLEOS|nr:laccase [Pleurotus ostreatus]KAF7431223.1 laccase [Pleurotus ostreatus]
MSSLSSLAWLTLPILANAAFGPIADIHVVNSDIAPDGFQRPAVLVEGTYPAPLIAGNKGDHFQLNVINELYDTTMNTDTSIHWHGILHHSTNYADGAAMVTQCPIVPNESFLYDFHVPDQAGTYWYHSHLHAQYCDGLRGPFIVYDPEDPHKDLYDVDDESTILTIGDWYHTPSTEASVPVADSTLFNGIGRYAGGPQVPLYVFNVEFGKRYRLRLINIGCDPYYNFTIAGHNFTIIEADGENTRPHKVDFIQILAGQRYSIILDANQEIDNYWIRANPNPDSGIPGFVDGINSAILRYQGAPDAEPTQGEVVPAKPLHETRLHALENPSAPGIHVPGAADINIQLDFGLDFANGVFTVNGLPFASPDVPVLLQILSGAQTAQDILPPGSVFTLEPNKVVELTLTPLALGGPHPIHLHGHTFSVVKSAGSNSWNWHNPVRRDTVMLGVEDGDNVVIRFVTDNPGPWHHSTAISHIDWHLEIGFAAVFAEDPLGTAAANPVTPEWSDLCPLYNATQSRTPALLKTLAKSPSHRILPVHLRR